MTKGFSRPIVVDCCNLLNAEGHYTAISAIAELLLVKLLFTSCAM